jgi:hypothetical protein
MNAWKNDDWFYGGVVLAVEKGGVTLDRCAASLWGIECNYPKHPDAASAQDDFPNSYLTEAANELLDTESVCVFFTRSCRIMDHVGSGRRRSEAGFTALDPTKRPRRERSTCLFAAAHHSPTSARGR